MLNLEIRNPSAGDIFEQVNLAAGQRAFTDIIRLPHASYTVAGAVWQGRGDLYTLDVTVRNHPDDSSSVGIEKPVTAGVPYRVGKLHEDEFFVALTRAGEPAASPITKKMSLSPVLWWVLLAVVIAGIAWAVKRTGHRMARLGTTFLATSALLCVAFLVRVTWIFHGNAQRLEALDAERLASDIHNAQGIALLALVLFLVGAIFACLALFKYRYRARWFFRVLCATAVLMLIAFPIGTVLGVLLLMYVSQRRGEFISASVADAPPAAPPAVRKESRWWVWLLILPALAVLAFGALLLVFVFLLG